MKQYFFISLLVLISNLSIGQGKLSKDQKFVFLHGLYGDIPIAILEVVPGNTMGYYRQYIIRNSDNEVELIINKRFIDLDSLKTKDNRSGSLDYLEFVFTDSLLVAQVACSEKNENDLMFIKKIVAKLCGVISGCGNCPTSYGLNYAWVKEFIKENPVKYFLKNQK